MKEKPKDNSFLNSIFGPVPSRYLLKIIDNCQEIQIDVTNASIADKEFWNKYECEKRKKIDFKYGRLSRGSQLLRKKCHCQS